MNARTKFRPPVALVLLAILGTLALPACGDDDDDGGPSQEDFAAQADSICAAADKKQAAIKGERSAGLSGNFNNPEYLKDWSEAASDAVAKLENVEAPDESQEAFDSLISSLKRALSAIDDKLKSLDSGDEKAGSQATVDYERSYGDAQAAAGSAGLTRCQGLAN